MHKNEQDSSKKLPSCSFCFYLLEEQCIIAVEEDEEDNQRQDIGCIKAHPFREGNALAGVNLFDELIPAPAVAGGAEGQEHQTAERQDIVADEEVLQVQHAGAFAQRLEAAPDVEAENAWQGQQNHADNSEGDETTAVTAGQLADAGDNHLENSDNCGQRCEEHEEEEERAPDTSAAHSVEHVGQRDEEQVRTSVRLDTKAKAGREDNQAGNDSYKGIEEHNPQCLVSELLLLADVAAEDGQRAHADAQREEGLAHSSEDYLAHAMLRDFAEVRIEIISQALSAARQHDGVDSEHQHQQDEADHHRLCDALYAIFYAQIAHAEADHNDNSHVACHSQRILQQAAKNSVDALCVQTGEIAYRHFIEEVEHPAADSGVEHHEDDVAGDGDIFEQMPFSTLRLKRVEGFCRAASAGAANGELCYHDGQAQKQQKAQINEHKGCAAILTCNKRKAPDVA